jgi:hypothetical protein
MYQNLAAIVCAPAPAVRDTCLAALLRAKRVPA